MIFAKLSRLCRRLPSSGRPTSLTPDTSPHVSFLALLCLSLSPLSLPLLPLSLPLSLSLLRRRQELGSGGGGVARRQAAGGRRQAAGGGRSLGLGRRLIAVAGA